MSFPRTSSSTRSIAVALAWCVTALGVFSAAVPAAARSATSATALLGQSQVVATTDSNPAGTAEAFAAAAGVSGSLRSLRLFVDSSSQATALQLGLYTDSGGRPGRLLASGQVTSPRAGQWNAADIPATEVSAGVQYWLVLLGAGGEVVFRDACCGGGSAAVSSLATNLSSLPAAWSSGTLYNDGPASFFGSTEPASTPDGEQDPPAGEATVTAELSKGLQTVDGLGVNANVHSWNGGELKPAIDKLADAGVTTWRVIIDRCDFEAANDDADPSQFNMAYYGDVYERGKMADLWNTLAYVQTKPGAQVVLSCMGGVPLWMGGTAEVSQINADKEDEWVEMLASLVYYARVIKHLDLTLLSPANEVDWDGNEGPQIAPAQYVRLLHKLSDRLDGLGLDDIRFVGPDTANAATGATSYLPAMLADPVVADRLARVAIHTYDGHAGDIDEAIESSTHPNLEWWATEFSAWCSGCDSGAPNPDHWSFAATTGSYMFDLLDQGASGMQVYDGWDGYYEHHGAIGYWGLLGYDALSGDYAPRKTFYVLENFTKFVPGGSVLTASSSGRGDLTVESFRDPGTGRVTLVVRNSAGSGQTVTGALVGGPDVRRLETYVTSASANFARGDDVAVAGGKFSVTIPADSLMTLTGTPADAAVPTAAFASPHDGDTVTGVVDVEVDAADDVGVASVEFAVDGQPAGVDDTAPYTFEWDTKALADGPHTVTAVARDTAGKVSVPASVTVQVPQANTSTNIDDGPPAATQDSTPAFTFSSAEADVSFECRLDGPGGQAAAFAPCSSPLTLPALADGGYVLLVRAVDRAGNADPTPASRAFVVDTTAPPAPVVSAPADGRVQREAQIAFAGTGDPSDNVLVEEDGAARGSATVEPAGGWALELAAVADGTHAYEVRAHDAAGNVSVPAKVSIRVDSVEPDTAITAGPSGVTGDASPEFAVASSESGSRFECRLDGPDSTTGDFTACSSPVSFAALADGAYTVRVRAVDAAGNTDATPGVRAFTIDTKAPDAPLITAPQDGSVQSTSTIVLAGTVEAFATVLVDESGVASGSANAEATGHWALQLQASSGAHTYSARARDAAGNVSLPRDVSVRVDATEPDTAIVAGPAGATNIARPVFGFSSPEPGASFQCRLDGPGGATGAYAVCASPMVLGTLPDGEFVVRVRAVDAAGNVDGTPAARSFTVDTVAPETTIDSGPASTLSERTTAFGFSSSEAGARMQCSLGGPGSGGAFESCASPAVLSGLADGDYTFAVRGTDAAGNVDSTPASRRFAVQATPAAEPFEPPALMQPFEPPGLTQPVAVVTPEPVIPAVVPVFRQTVVVRATKGAVLARRPGTAKAVAVTSSQAIPLGSVVDTKAGEVQLTARPTAAGATATVTLRGGSFQVAQAAAELDLRLNEALAPCSTARLTRSKKPKVRRLWTVGSGPFRVRGSYSTARAGSGTWLVEDSCAATTTRVTAGAVEVGVQGKRTPVKLRAGRTYVARAPR